MSDSDIQLSVKTIQKCESSVSFFEKPPTVRGICSVETGLPVIAKSQKPGTRKVCSLEPTKRPLKKKMILPKLEQKKIPQQFDAGEPCVRYNSFSTIKRSESVVSSEETFILRSCDRDSSESGEKPAKKLELNISKGRLEELMRKIDEEEQEENKALKRWEFWMKDKKRIQNYISKKIGRHPNNLMLQESDKYRKVMEKKILHTYSNTEKIDKFEEKKVIKSKRQIKSNRPTIECVRIPDGIKVEKGFEIQDAKEESFQDEVSSMSSGRKKEGLMIIGKRIFEEKEPTETSISSDRLPEIITPSEEQQTPDITIEERTSVFCLVIDGEEIKYQIGAGTDQNSPRNFTWDLDFGVRTTKSIAEKTLSFENRGTMAIKYDWFAPDVEQKKYFGVLQLKNRESWFFFNKNSGFFLPGQIYELKFYLYARTSGIRKETWYMRTNPPLSENQDFGAINISAVATEVLSEHREPLETYLRNRVRDSIVFYITQRLLRKVFRIADNLRGIEYRSIFCEKDLFECHNPKYYYHSSIVKELYEIYRQISHNSNAEWDMSLDSLVSLTKKLELRKERNASLMEISKLAKRLLRPNHFPESKSTKKYKMSYGILCKAVNSMEEDYDYLRSLVSEKPKGNTRKKVLDEEESNEGMWAEEFGEFDPFLPMIVIKSVNFVFFQTLFYIKVYHRLCEAVEGIVGSLETAKLFEPWKQGNNKVTKPVKNLTFCSSK